MCLKNYFYQLPNVHVNYVRQIVHTVEPLVLGPSHLEIGTAVAKLKKYNSPGSDHILTKLFQAGGETLPSVIHELINSI
jgi:hypothetical protein